MPRSVRENGTRKTRAISRSDASARRTPSRTFRYTGGKTISAEMKNARLRLGSHTSARMMNDATGTALMTATSGASSSSTQEKRAESAASMTANAHESRKPPKICAAEASTARQNAAVPASVKSRSSAERGDASSSAPCG